MNDDALDVRDGGGLGGNDECASKNDDEVSLLNETNSSWDISEDDALGVRDSGGLLRGDTYGV